MKKKAVKNAADTALPGEKPPRKKIKKSYIFGGLVLVIGIGVWYGLQPLKGTMYLGICRTFAEMQLAYPQTFKITGIENFDRSQRIYYTAMGPFGEYRSDMIDCRFTVNPTTGSTLLEDVQINRVSVAPQKVRDFNKTLPAVVAGKPNLVIPFPPKDTLVDLKRE